MPHSVIPFYEPFLPDLDEYSMLLKEIWKNRRVTNNGPLVNQLERHLKNYLGVKHVILVSSGTIGLQLCIKAASIEGNVLTTPFSYVASTSSIAWENCSPVYEDIEPNSFSFPISAHVLKEKKVKAILPVHVFGFPFWGEKKESLSELRIPFIVDAAHAFGVKQNGETILQTPANWLNVVSLHATKIFHTIEGGAIITSDDSTASSLRSIRNFGYGEAGNPVRVGINAKMSEVHAAMGLAILPRVKKMIAVNKKIHESYCEVLAKNPSLFTPAPAINTEHNYSFFPVICSSPQTLKRFVAHLERNRIGYKRYFNFPLNKLPYVQYASCPEAEKVAKKIICLPLYPALKDRQVEKICSALESFKD